MSVFNIRVEILESSVDIKINGNSVNLEDLLVVLQKAGTKSDKKTNIDPNNQEASVEDMWSNKQDEVSKIVDETFKGFEDSFEGFDKIFGDVSSSNPFDFAKVKAAQESVKTWGDTAREYIEFSKASQNNQSKEGQIQQNKNYFGVVSLVTKMKYSITSLEDLKSIPNFYTVGQEANYEYYFGSKLLERNEFLKEIMFGTNKLI